MMDTTRLGWACRYGKGKFAFLVVVVILLLPTSGSLSAQGLNNVWLGGYEDEAPPPWGPLYLDFIAGNMIVDTTVRTIDFKRTSANITDQAGNILISTNGAYLANTTGDTLLNGTSLNPSWYTGNYPEGLHIVQSCLILPKPEHSEIFYLIHGTLDDPVGFLAERLYLTTIDMSLDGGVGGVVTKNETLIEDQLNIGKITATRHANGRDWWVVCHKVNTNIFYRLLITPDGIYVDGTQSIGIVRPRDNGQVCFSPNGDKFAYFYYAEGLEVFDFDRCTGEFMNNRYINSPDTLFGTGVAFSPNGSLVYVTSTRNVYQYDTEVVDIEASKVHIAQWDGFYSPFPPLATMFDIAQLAPDGKIYIGTGNSTMHLHVIHDPDDVGLACNIEQHGVELPRLFMNSLPNHPNYHLGPIDGSICDSLGINASVADRDLPISISAYPNPSNNSFTLSYPARSVEGSVDVLDAAGRMIYRKRLAQWTTMHQLDLTGQASGMYHCRLSWGDRTASTRLIIQNTE